MDLVQRIVQFTSGTGDAETNKCASKTGPSGSGIKNSILGVILDALRIIVLAVVVYCQELYKLLLPTKKSLNGEVILITGSAGGLGQEMCKQLAHSGAKLVLWDVSTQSNKELAEVLRDMGAKHVFEDTVDITDHIAVKTAAKKVRSAVGPVSILVNNAGIAPVTEFLDMSPTAVRKTFDVNILAHFWTIQEFLPHMIENKGHIISIASTLSFVALRGCAPYTASKHAVEGFVESIKDELSTNGITNVKFTTVYPFFINTNLVKDAGFRLSFRFPSLTPFMEPSYVAEQIVDAIRCEKEYLYLPFHSKLYLFVKPYIPTKLNQALANFLLEELDVTTQKMNESGHLSSKEASSTRPFAEEESQNNPSI